MRYVRSKLFRLIIFIASLLVIVTLPQSIYSLWKKRDIVSERKLVFERIKSENERLKRELAEAQTPQYIEEQAREKLNMVKEGEKIVLMPKSQISMTNDQLNQDKEEQTPNWKRWWRLFF